MYRRNVLVAVAGTAGLSGCTGILGGSGDGDQSTTGSNGGPAATVEAFYDAALSGDAETARSYFHPSSELPPPSDAAIRQVANSTLRLENTTVISRSESSATVRLTVSQERSMREGRLTNTITYELRRSDGEWLLYAMPLPDSPATTPNAEWEIEVQRDGDEVAAVEFTHVGGDDLATASLRVEIGGFTMGPRSASGNVSAGDVIRAPFGPADPAVPADETVSVVWTDGGSAELGTYELETRTTGQPANTFEIVR